MDNLGQPNYWQSSTLGELGRWYSGGTPDTSNPAYWNGDIPWITSSSMYDFNITNSERKVTELGVQNGTRLVPANTILIVVRGMSLKKEFRVGITRREVAFGQDCKAIIPNENVDPLFLAYVLQFKASEVVGLADESSHGTGRLQTSLIQALEIPLPPLAEQRKIAAILGTWDAAIATVEQLVAGLQRRKQGLMQRLLTGEVRFPEFAGSEWEEVQLGDVAEVIMGQSPSSAAYNSEGNGLPLIQGNADITNRRTAPRTFTTEFTKHCKIGDIILSVRAPVGETALSLHEAIIGRGVCAIRGKNVSQRLLYQTLLYNEPRWQEFAQGSTFTAINSTDIRAFGIRVPIHRNEQSLIADVLDTADVQLQNLAQYQSIVKEQKQALMQQLLTGQVRVNVGEESAIHSVHASLL